MKEEPTDRPLISIIVATLQAGRVLPALFDSIAALQIPLLEVWVMDGGSTDGTLSVLDTEKRFLLKYISGKDNGIYDAYNKGTRVATGRWLYFIGADDRLLPGFREIARWLTEPSTVYYGNPTPYYSGPAPGFILLGGKFSKYRLAKFPMNHQSILYPSSVFEKYIYEERFQIFADYALTMQVWGDRAFRQQYLPFTVVQYHMNGFSSSLNDPVFAKEKNRLIRQRLGWPVYARYRFKQWKKHLTGEQERQ